MFFFLLEYNCFTMFVVLVSAVQWSDQTWNESEVTQSCPTLCDPIDSNLPGSSVIGFSKQKHWSCPLLLQGIFLTQG